MPRDPEQSAEELRYLADGIPFRRLGSVEHLDLTADPPSVRQERNFPSVRSQAPVNRFLTDRGVVEILDKPNTSALFEEIHWCISNCDLLAASPPKGTAKRMEALKTARRLMMRIEAAEEELFIANRRMVASCIKPYYWIGEVWLSDFLQEGAKALTNAIRKFDYTRGTPFFSYSQIAVKNRLRNFFRDHVRAGSLNIRPSEDMKRVKEIKDRWKDQHRDDPPVEILAKMCGMELAHVKKLMPFIRQWERMPGPPISLDALVGESNASFYELIEDTKSQRAEQSLEHSEVWDAIAQLPERSGKILRMRFVDGCTLEETGNELGLTRARIKQIQDEAVNRLRRILGEG